MGASGVLEIADDLIVVIDAVSHGCVHDAQGIGERRLFASVAWQQGQYRLSGALSHRGRVAARAGIACNTGH
jgi:hypothetical protein